MNIKSIFRDRSVQSLTHEAVDQWVGHIVWVEPNEEVAIAEVRITVGAANCGSQCGTS